MKLNLPERKAPIEGATPNHPRKLKKVLSALPNTNMGELTKQTYIILRDLNRKSGLQLPLEGPKTLNGLILEYFQDIPETGTGLKIDGCRMEILQTNNQGVKTVRIYPNQPIPQRESE